MKGVKSLLTGLGVTMKEYFIPKVTEQYPENRKTTLHVSERHRGRLVMPNDAEATISALPVRCAKRHVPTALSR